MDQWKLMVKAQCAFLELSEPLCSQGSSPKATLSLIASGNEEGEQQETEKERGGGLSLRIECFYGSCLRWEGLTLL